MAAPIHADATLDNLVAQFARPMDCLRELVQNAMDAGTPRVDVWLAYSDGVLEIHVDDAGGGMDETIIDEQLTKLFSSTKEGDRTKIGKFGIGFSSIFAIQPDAVLLRTGRHGENWELVFHPDRSYDKAAIDEPVQGTQITLFKRMDEADVPGMVVEARDVLAYWCEHAMTPITFSDHTAVVEQVEVDAADPFAAFAEPSGPEVESISGPLHVDAVVSIDVAVDDIEAVVGVGRGGAGPYGFYNGGLTLVSAGSPEVLGEHGADLAHLSFKVRCDQLEHTLTRDNVLQDETFHRVLGTLRSRRPELVRVAVEALGRGEGDADRLLDFLVAEHRVLDAPPAPSEAVVIRDHRGEPWTVAEALAQGARYGAVLMEGPMDPDLELALMERDIRLLPVRAWVRGLATVWTKPGWRRTREPWDVRRPRDLFLQADLREPRSGPEAALFEAAERLLGASEGSRLTLALGAFDEGLSDPELVVVGPSTGELFLRKSSGWRWVVETLGWRRLVLNGAHPFVRAQVLAAERDPLLAAQGLLLVVLDRVFDGARHRLAQQALVEVRR